MLLKDYIEKFGAITIVDKNKVFWSNGKNAVGGSFKDFKKRGML